MTHLLDILVDMIKSISQLEKNTSDYQSKIKSIFLIGMAFIISSCGGGGGGGGASSIPTQTATYNEYVSYINSGGLVPNSQGMIFRSRGQEFNSPYQAPQKDFANFSSSSLEYSTPDASGNQTITLSATVNWDGNIFSGSETITGTLDSNDGSVYRFLNVPEYYNKLYSFYDEVEDTSSNDPESKFLTWTVAFADFDDSPRTVEKTRYVTQFGQYRQQYSDNVGFYGTNYSYNYDLVVFVMGDLTENFDMPSGSATYNGFTQMYQTVENRPQATISKAYINGTATFNVNFANREFSGTLDFKNAAWADSPQQASPGSWNEDFQLDLNGSISGTSFSGTVVNPNLLNSSDNIQSSFSGSFFGPKAAELGGTFNYSNIGYESQDGSIQDMHRIGSFTGCQGC